MKYHQLTSEERYLIALLRQRHETVSEIARQTGRSRSTIYREVKRNGRNNGSYQSKEAQSKSVHRRKRARRVRQFSSQEFGLVVSKLKLFWSPEQIAGHLKLEGLLEISHETIYRYIQEDKLQGGSLYKLLRHSRKKGRKRRLSIDNRGRLKGKRHISERSPEIENRSEFGHWEADTIVGSETKVCFMTLVERKSGYTIVERLENRSMKELNRAFLRVFRRSPEWFKTVTADNGTEFHGYKTLEHKTSARFYFATAYHSWERGTNENTNGLIRQYAPKRTNLAKFSRQSCKTISTNLNRRPRKRLGYLSPEQVFFKAMGVALHG